MHHMQCKTLPSFSVKRQHPIIRNAYVATSHISAPARELTVKAADYFLSPTETTWLQEWQAAMNQKPHASAECDA